VALPASDIDTYTNYYRLPSVNLQNVLIDGRSGRAGSGAFEVTLDIEEFLEEQPSVAEAAVIGIPETVRGEVPVACVVPRGAPDVAAHGFGKDPETPVAAFPVFMAGHRFPSCDLRTVGNGRCPAYSCCSKTAFTLPFLTARARAS
jgi:hypothetical protein